MPSLTSIIKEAEELAEALTQFKDDTTLPDLCEEIELLNEKIRSAKKAKVKPVKVKKLTGADASIVTKKLKKKYEQHLEKIGKNQTVSVKKILELNNKGKMPIMLKHCVVAVQKKLKGEGKVNSFIGAHNICFWSFERYNLIDKNGNKTGRGMLREKYHRSKDDPDASKKTKQYNKTFNSVFKE